MSLGPTVFMLRGRHSGGRLEGAESLGTALAVLEIPGGPDVFRMEPERVGDALFVGGIRAHQGGRKGRRTLQAMGAGDTCQRHVFLAEGVDHVLWLPVIATGFFGGFRYHGLFSALVVRRVSFDPRACVMSTTFEGFLRLSLTRAAQFLAVFQKAFIFQLDKSLRHVANSHEEVSLTRP